MLKKIIITLLVLLVIIQFIRPTKNQSADENKAVATVYDVPNDVQSILQNACYDCHSNYTTYPWYTNIQPIGWWMQNHVNEGKHHLNFSIFASYPAKKQKHKLEEIIELVAEKAMPLDSYTWMHKEAKLTDQQRTALTNWAKKIQAKIIL